MAQSPSMGASAQILTHARFDRPAVVQTRRCGRLPNSVINYRNARYEIRTARHQEQERLEEIELTRDNMATHARLVSYFQGRLALLTQTKGAANV